MDLDGTHYLQDRPLDLFEEQTISAPHMHALMLELLEPYLPEGSRALDVGSGASQLGIQHQLERDQGFIALIMVVIRADVL